MIVKVKFTCEFTMNGAVKVPGTEQARLALEDMLRRDWSEFCDTLTITEYEQEAYTMKVEIVHASIAENGTINGRPGDQTGGEVCRRALYDRDWKGVLRPRRSEIAVESATQAQQAAANQHIGYSQADRYSLYNYLADFDITDMEDVDEDVCCDCSSLITSILYLIGISIPRGMWTGSEEEALLGTGEYYSLPYEDGMKLLMGDILLAIGHTAIVVSVTSDPEIVKRQAEYADMFSPSMAGLYRPRTLCNLRYGPGIDRDIIQTLSVLDECYNYGYYSLDNRGVVWLLLLTDTGITGWMSSKVVYREDGNVEE